MYQALYRKYRPKTLNEVGGQDTIVKIIQNSIENNHINHAYLFAGPRGTGKTSIAKIFARMVNCEKLENGVPCGKCVSCIEQNNSDIVEIDAASNNGVDEIRELRSKVSLVPSYGKYKVYIIDEVHMLTTGAFNALLKTLEEPPSHIIFILATTDPHKIPETILSRCQRLDFKKINDESIVNRLKEIVKLENIEVDEEALKEIARLSDGGMRDSIGMLDQAVAYSTGKITPKDIHDINGTLTAEELKALIEDIAHKNIKEILQKLDFFNAKGKNFVKTTEEIITFMRNIILCQNAEEYFKSINNNIEIYKNISQEIDLNTILTYIEILNNTLIEMKTTSNTKLLLELAIIKMMNINNNEVIGEKNKNVENFSENIVSKQNEKPTAKEIVENKGDNQLNKTNQTEKENEIVEKEATTDESLMETKKQDLPVAKISDDVKEKLENIKNIRINNTLSQFSKKHLLDLINKMNNFNDYLLDSDINNYIEIILDGALKAASETNMIFVYKNERTTNLFNENIPNIEKAISKVLKSDYKVIATDINSWDKIKQEFNSKRKKYEYIEEDFDIEKLFSNEINGEFNEFEDIIEYN
ncbi:MAG: DNA polymerase III subunit gamma/tau [Bacilli bacterium]|nr:DNA polymerase III subunit gamma/tau [Bacilli bacterium]